MCLSLRRVRLAHPVGFLLGLIVPVLVVLGKLAEVCVRLVVTLAGGGAGVGLGNAMQASDLRSCLAIDHHRMLLLSIFYRLLRCLLGLVAVLVRRDLTRTPNYLSYDTRTPCYADKLTASASRPPTECGWPPYPGSYCGTAGPKSSRSLPLRS